MSTMLISLRISLLLGMLVYFICIYILLIRKSINLKYTLLWLATGVTLVLLVVFPNILYLLSKVTGVIDINNALFAVILFFILIILMSITAIVSKLKNQNKILIQKYAILEKRLKELENNKRQKG